ncbi:polysaccharide deacetylase family protein [Candidatus Epulonipiscium viviparus]|uniref:polysaccharide deacetylase family protein n=1 Tax=Candidatus Epulonipiscium viviparus TaxID=420336 RepID=UPI00016C0B16|nr:polysaccharide deacetylase family protein [Candidatus Epulopiscium viviparus]
MYPNGATKAVTFSYDDGVTQDKRLVEIFNHYGLKATFNINSGLTDDPNRLTATQVRELYTNHEIACHGRAHLRLPDLTLADATEEIVEDKRNLEALLKRDVRGMAYSFGQVNDAAIAIMKDAGIVYGRAVKSTFDFALPTNWYRWLPTTHHKNDELFDLIDQYKKLNSKDLSLFYIWGHSYEFDNCWDRIEKCAELLSNRDDIWYCTNIELYDYIHQI